MNQAEWYPQINQERCISCGDCITQCPTAALGQQYGKAALVYPESCVYCSSCEDICPVNAIELPFLIIMKHNLREGV